MSSWAAGYRTTFEPLYNRPFC